eukprot:475849_1
METTIDTVTVDLGDHTNYNLFPLPIRSSTNKSNNISKNISNSIQTDICKMTKLLVIISFLLMAVIPFKRSLDQDQYNLFNYLIIWNVIFRSITLLLSNISIKRSFIYSSIVIIIIYFSLWYAMPNPAGTAWTFRVLSTFAYCLILVIDELFIAHNDSEKIGIFRFEILNNLFLFVTSALIGHMYRVFYPVYFMMASIIGLIWTLISKYRQCRLKGIVKIKCNQRTFGTIGLLIIAWLVLTEFYHYIFPQRREHNIIDSMYDKQLEISFAITFHSISCPSFGVCIMDVAGEQQVHTEMLNHEIHKTRLDLHGNVLHDELTKEHPGIINETIYNEFSYILNMFDTKLKLQNQYNLSNVTIKNQWSNMSETEKRVFRNDILRFNDSIHELLQYVTMDRAAEGCRVTGKLHVQKVSGKKNNFRFETLPSILKLALGLVCEIHGNLKYWRHTDIMKHIHQFFIIDISRFNTSHTIHHLSFGGEFPGQILPLNGIEHTIKKQGGGMFTYNLKIIPIEYIPRWGSVTHSNTYEYDYKYRHILPGTRQLPGLFFVYKINPYMLQISENQVTFATFLVPFMIASIIGLVWTLISGYRQCRLK